MFTNRYYNCMWVIAIIALIYNSLFLAAQAATPNFQTGYVYSLAILLVFACTLHAIYLSGKKVENIIEDIALGLGVVAWVIAGFEILYAMFIGSESTTNANLWSIIRGLANSAVLLFIAKSLKACSGLLSDIVGKIKNER